jgi:Protein of unknown function DUF262
VVPETYVSDEELLLDDAGAATESEEDLEGDPHRFTEAVVTATDWTTETVLSQLGRGNIQLNPRFQRRDAWTAARKSRFIESLFLGLPIPQLVLAEQRGKRGSYIVIDGKQRLLTLRQFASNPDDTEFDQLRLRGLEVRQDLNGMTLDRLQCDGGFLDALAAFDNQTIRTVVVRNWPNEDFLYLVFLRLNTGSVPLSPQELRQALHPGPFMDFADDFASESSAIREALRISKPDFRMRDVELLVRYFAFTDFLPLYDGNLKRSLDRTCERLNEEWRDREDRIRADAARCEVAITTTLDIFGSEAFRRFSGGSWERRFNRAVFDVMVFYFRDDAVAERARRRAAAVVDAYKRASEIEEFQESLQTTTKSIGATGQRLTVWGAALSEALQMKLPVVILDEGRIRVQ